MATREWTGLCGPNAASPHNWIKEDGSPCYRCERCKDRHYVEISVPCPDGNPGCCVAHLDTIKCPECRPNLWRRFLGLFGKKRPQKEWAFVQAGDTVVIPRSTTIDTLYVTGGTVCNSPPQPLEDC